MDQIRKNNQEKMAAQRERDQKKKRELEEKHRQ